MVVNTARPHIDVPEHLSSIPNAPAGWDWRPASQRDITSRIVNSPKKIVILQGEPGSGKTTMAWAAAKLLGGQSIIMVRTRQLERQYLRDFSELLMMEGRRHFVCNISHDNRTADRAACTIGYKCPLAGRYNPSERRYTETPACDYFGQKSRVINAQISIHNYSYWLGETKALAGVSGFESPNFIVCDEAHELERILMEHEVIEINPRLVRAVGLEAAPRNDILILKQWAERNLPYVRSLYALAIEQATEDGIIAGPDAPRVDLDVSTIDVGKLSTTVDNLKELAQLIDPLAKLATITDTDLEAEWVLDTEDKRTHIIKVRPVFGKVGVQRIIDAARTKVLFMSAYLAPQLFMETLGLDPDDCEVIEAEQVYDRRQSPIIYMPVHKLNYQTPDYVWDRVVKIIDCAIDYWAPKKGLVHVPSVALRNRIVQGSRHRNLLVTYDGEYMENRLPNALTKDEAIESFKARKDGCVLLGQSIGTGVDIPYHPQWQIIVKMPFPPPGDPAMKRRMELDKAFYVYLTLCDLVQATGRIKRAPDHDGPTLILDTNFGWFRSANRAHFPAWFESAYSKVAWDKALPKFRQQLLSKGVVMP